MRVNVDAPTEEDAQRVTAMVEALGYKATTTGSDVQQPTRRRAPFPYYGSKIEAALLIEQLMGPIKNLVVPFAGSLGEVLGRSEPAPVETANDADGLLVNAWRSITYSPERTAELCDHPVHEATLHAAQESLIDRAPQLLELLRSSPIAHDPELGAWWVWGRSCWLGGGWCRETRSRRRPESPKKRPHLQGQGERPSLGRGVARPLSPHNRLVVHGREGSPFLGHGVVKPLRGTSLSLSGGGGAPAKGTGVHARQNRERLIGMFVELAARLRWVRVTCGDWQRVLTPAVTTSHGLTGVSLDPPYSTEERKAGLYRHDEKGIAEDVRAWAAEHGNDPLLRIVVAGKNDEHADLEVLGWTRYVWRERDGETVWASPGCARPVIAKQLRIGGLLG